MSIHFLDLPDNLLEQVGRTALANNVCDVLYLCQACQTLHTKLDVARALAEMRRLCWLPEVTSKHIRISNKGRTVTVVNFDDSIEPWVAGRILPTSGKSAWQVRVDRSDCNDGNGVWIGVCDAEARFSWGLSLYSGRLRCISRDADGQLDYDPPPEGYPNGNYTVVIKDAAGQRTDLHGIATGAVIEVFLDHDAGTLGYGINSGPYFEAMPFEVKDRRYLKGKPKTVFPQGAALRPYASCYYLGDHLSFVTANV